MKPDKKLIDQFPCKVCIVYVICRNRYLKYTGKINPVEVGSLVVCLSTDCEIFRKWFCNCFEGVELDNYSFSVIQKYYYLE